MNRTGLMSGVLVLLAAGCAVGAQEARRGVQQDPAMALREIDDPHSGARWLLVKDLAHPGGPGHLVRVKRDETAGAGSRLAVPMIHTGDHVVVEEHSEVVDAVLEAVALGPAVEGGLFSARLNVGGRVLRVAAIAPGRAQLRLGGEVSR
jgi:hypothetical protein